MALQWVPKAKPQRRKKPCRKKWPKKYKSSSHWVPKNLLWTQGYYTGNSWIWLPKNILPNTQPRAKQVTVRAQDTKKASSQWVPKSLLMAQGYCDGNSRIWIPKRVLAHITCDKHKHEQSKFWIKANKSSKNPLLPRIVCQSKLPNPHMSKGNLHCNSLEKLSQSLSIISPIPSPAGTLAPQASHDNMMAMLPSVLPYNKTNTPNEDDDTMAESADFDGMVQ